MGRAQIDTVAGRWAEKAADRRNPDWLQDFLCSLGGAVAAAPGGQLLVAAQSAMCFRVAKGDNWSMAEALGHVALHLPHAPLPDHPCGDFVALAVPAAVAPGSTFAQAKMEAAWFAGAFLMPEEAFREVWARCDGNIRAASAAMGMPMGAMAKRAYRLGLA